MCSFKHSDSPMHALNASYLSPLQTHKLDKISIERDRTPPKIIKKTFFHKKHNMWFIRLMLSIYGSIFDLSQIISVKWQYLLFLNKYISKCWLAYHKNYFTTTEYCVIPLFTFTFSRDVTINRSVFQWNLENKSKAKQRIVLY